MPLMIRVGAAAAPLAAAAMALVWAYVYGGGAEPGIFDHAGLAVTWGLPAAKLVFNIASAGTIGTLVLALFALPRDGQAYRAALRFAAWSAVLWAAGATVHTAATFLFIANAASSASLDEAFIAFFTQIDAGRAGALTAVTAAAVAVSCFCLHSSRMVAITVLLAFAGLVPLALKSHAAGGADHADSTTSIVVHAAAAAVWLGGLLALVALRRALPGGQLAVVVRRYSTLALISFIALAASGFLAAWTRTSSIEGVLSPYGGILLAKAAALIVLGLFGALHRRWSLNRLDRDRDRGGRHFAALAVAELAVMGAASGMAAALGRTEPPPAVASGDLDALLPQPGLWEYTSRWAPDPLWSLACGFAVFFYLAGIRRLRAEGRSWPLHRTVLWLAGVAVLFAVTNGGIHIYQGYLFSAHVLTQMALTSVVPLLLVPAAPLALAVLTVRDRADGSEGAKEFLLGTLQPALTALGRNPSVSVFILALCLFATYNTPLLDWSVRDQIGYSAMTVLALLSGCLVTTALGGAIDSGGQSFPRRLLPEVSGVAGLYGFWGWGWKLSDQASALEEPWHVSVGQPWVSSPAAAPELGATLMWSLGAASVTIIALMLMAHRSPDPQCRTGHQPATQGMPARVARGCPDGAGAGEGCEGRFRVDPAVVRVRGEDDRRGHRA